MAPAWRRQHRPARRPRHVHRALEVEVDHLVESVVAEEPEHALACDACVVHHHVETVPPGDRSLDEVIGLDGI